MHSVTFQGMLQQASSTQLNRAACISNPQWRPPMNSGCACDAGHTASGPHQAGSNLHCNATLPQWHMSQLYAGTAMQTKHQRAMV
jgi:hypothetical protein